MVIKLGRMTSFIFKGDYSNDENRERLPEKPGNIKALYLAIVFLILGGLGCLKYIVPDIIAWTQSIGCEQTTGYVKYSEQYDYYSGRYRKASNHTVTFDTIVEYTIDDQTYTQTVYTGTNYFNMGESVKVYYKKGNPENAVTDIAMKRTPTFTSVFMFGLGAALLILYLLPFKIVDD